MRLRIVAAVLFSASFAPLLSGASALAQAAWPAAPVPPALTHAKNLFVSNAGADAGLFPQTFSGDQSRGYNELYGTLEQSGKYQLVGDSSQADLVLELRLEAPPGRNVATVKAGNLADPLPQFRLVVYDAKNHYVLWALTSEIEFAYSRKNHDRNFDQSLSNLLHAFEQVSGKATP
ncbi:MAG: hypothetical protein WA294_08930 [Acidobacteriaceae bacterium]